MRGRIKLSDIWHYIVGNIRYFMYYNPMLCRYVPYNIRRQIEFRIEIMDSECYNNGSCVKCGCKTTALQMASKSCDKPCYPPFMKEELFDEFISGKQVSINGTTWKLVYVGKYVCLLKNGLLVHNKNVQE